MLRRDKTLGLIVKRLQLSFLLSDKKKKPFLHKTIVNSGRKRRRRKVKNDIKKAFFLISCFHACGKNIQGKNASIGLIWATFKRIQYLFFKPQLFS